ncbi:MAG: NYN domain-containing protein, partial [Promethearchaeota archaeon]
EITIDTDLDFITPEFLNILFFQQKNVVIFPYVDLKHLHALEIFTVGHNIIDLESTALHNLKEILEFESNNSYSQTPSLYYVYNLDKSKLKEVLDLENIRCLLNANENVSELVNGSDFVFFNKKSNQFLNFEYEDLEFEEYLVTSSGTIEVLQDTIQKIKLISSRIFAEINQDSSLDNLPQLLQDFDKKYWNKILDFTRNYFEIEIPNNPALRLHDKSSQVAIQKKELKDFSEEYTILVSTNKNIGKEFVQLLHDYRSKKVNSSHLELEQLFNPLELYNYLRNHHWKEEIPNHFVKEWSEMTLSQYKLTEQDQLDFERILKKLGISTSQPLTPYKKHLVKKRQLDIIPKPPSPSNDWNGFKKWMLSQLDVLEKNVNKTTSLDSLEQTSEMIEELSALARLLSKKKTSPIKESIKGVAEFPPQTDFKLKPNIVFVDTTNILNEEKNEKGLLKVENIAKISKELESQGYDYEHIIDASSRYMFDNIEKIDSLLAQGKVTQSPYGRKADVLILEYAKRFEGKILSNDGFTEEAYKEKYGREWIYNNRLTCKFMRGAVIIL